MLVEVVCVDKQKENLIIQVVFKIGNAQVRRNIKNVWAENRVIQKVISIV